MVAEVRVRAPRPCVPEGFFISISDFQKERIEPVVFVTDRHPHSEHELGHKPPSSFQFVHHNEKM